MDDFNRKLQNKTTMRLFYSQQFVKISVIMQCWLEQLEYLFIVLWNVNWPRHNEEKKVMLSSEIE